MIIQEINIGTQGNTGTGDSIREAFRKVNENFAAFAALMAAQLDPPKAWTVITNNYDAINNDRLFVDTSVAGFTIKLPPNPTIGDTISISDYASSFNINPAILDNNGRRILGRPVPFVLDKTNFSLVMVYSGTAKGWINTTNTGISADRPIQMPWVLAASDILSIANTRVFADTSAASFTVSLPANPMLGDIISISDYSSTFDTTPVLIDRNGQLMFGIADNVSLDIRDYNLVLLFSGFTKGWVLAADSLSIKDAPVQIPPHITIIAHDYVATANERIFADTSRSPIAITLPANPKIGDLVSISDYASTFDTHHVTVARNGQLILGLPDALTIDMNDYAVVLAFTGIDKGWILAAGDTPIEHDTTDWVIVSTDYVAKLHDRIFADTSTSSFSIALPLNPQLGDTVSISDYSSSFGVRPVTVTGNGLRIFGTYNALTLNINDHTIDLVYSGATKGWIIGG